jgi:multiple sugar transport system permease protein
VTATGTAPPRAPATGSRRRRLFGESGLDTALPYLLLAPTVFLVLAVLVYPLLDGLRTSTGFYRFGRRLREVGWGNYTQALQDPAFRDSLVTTAEFVALAVALETLLGLALALLCAREVRFIRAVRGTLILPMIVTPVVVGIIFRLIYASDVGLTASLARAVGLSPPEILGQPNAAFLGLVVLDVWEWTPLLFLILLAGIQSLPVEPFEAARVDGAGPWRTFVDHTLPMLRPTILIAVTLRSIDALTTFDQVYVLTRGGPGTATQLVSIYGYQTFFQFQQFGYAAAMLLMVALVVIAAAGAAVAVMRRRRS